MAADLISRVKRIYAAINAIHEFKMEKLPAKVFRTARFHGVFQDFSGGQSEADLFNIAESLIYNIATLRDHLYRWATHNGISQAKVREFFKATDSLKIVMDLSNHDKHGPPTDKNPPWTSLELRLENVRREMQATTQAKAGSWSAMTLGPGGVPQIHGDGSLCGVVTGDVMDKEGNHIGDLAKIQLAAIEAWESLLIDLGVELPNRD